MKKDGVTRLLKKKGLLRNNPLVMRVYARIEVFRFQDCSNAKKGRAEELIYVKSIYALIYHLLERSQCFWVLGNVQ